MIKECKEKICDKCNKVLHPSNKTGLCNYHYHKEYHKEWQKNNKGKIKSYARKGKLLRLYNITLDEFNILLHKQNNKCAICNKKMNKICIDHNHETNRTRGLLCHNCNLLIGHAQENENILLSAIKYLQTHKSL